MGWGTQGSGQAIGLRGRVEAVNEVATDKGTRTEIEHTDAVLLVQGTTKDEVIEKPLPNGRKLVYFHDSSLFRNARDAFARLMGVGAGEEPPTDFIVGTTFQYKGVTGRTGYTDFIPEKVLEQVASNDAPVTEALTLDQVAALLDGKTPKEVMSLRNEPGIKGTAHANMITLKSKVPDVYPVDYDESTGTYKRRG